MSEQQQAPKPPDGGSGNSGTPAPVAPPPPAPQSFVISKDEWVDSRREIRSLKELISKMATPAAPPAPPSDDGKGKKGEQSPPAQVAPEVADRLARFELSEAIDESGLTLTREQKTIVKRLFVAEKPQNVGEWLTETVKFLPAQPAQVAAAPVVPIAPPVAPTNTGAPAPNAIAPNLPADPTKWPEDIIRKTPSKDFMAALTAYEQGQQGRAWNPYKDPELKPHLRKKG